MKNEKKEIESIKTLFVLIFLVLIVWIGTAILSPYLFNDWAASGTFGDTFGSINALFSGLAFAGLIYAISLQRKELLLQRKELALQREEISRSTAELRGQKELLNLQRFENTFFHLLTLHNEIISTLEANYGNNEAKGKQSFYIVHYHLKQVFWTGHDFLGLDYEEHYKIYFERFGHYIRNILEMLKLIINAKYLTENDKIQYINILKAQLSTHELTFIYYFVSIIGDHEGNMTKAIDKYKLLEHLDEKLLLHNDQKILERKLKEGSNIS